MNKLALLIPALDPPESLLTYVGNLASVGFETIIIVDDGSSKEYQPLFSKLENMENCAVLRHAVNLGKGRALKTGFNYYLNYHTDCNGLITADSDGQHTIDNVMDMADALDKQKNALILGCRDFNKENIPFKSRFGNKLTSRLFRLLYGVKISDTQTGLRGFSNELILQFLGLPGERFEYETNMLIEATRKNATIKEIPIDTIYINNNSATHFHPVRDSIRIYSLLLKEFFKFSMVSILSFVLDIAFFHIFTSLLFQLPLFAQIFAATAGARVLSSFFNCFSNWKIVFNSDVPMRKALARYYILCLIQMLCSAALVFVCVNLLHMPKVVIKILVDSLLFFASFCIQKKYIYHSK